MAECSVLSGEVQRTWHVQGKDGKAHSIDLYHDTISGTRSLAIDLVEVEGSLGTTPFYSRQATTLPFTVGDERGVVIIEKVGMLSFRYSCLVGGIKLRATLQDIAGEEEQYVVHVVNTAHTYETPESSVTWYELSVERRSDHAKTVVHRRYKEFCQLFDQIEAAFKGHHLRSSLPVIPGKQLKLLVDHSDPAFIEERRVQLDSFMQKLLGVPHVSSMVPVQIFLGLFEQIKEHSVVFRERELGLTLEVTTSTSSSPSPSPSSSSSSTSSLRGKGTEESIVVTGGVEGDEARWTRVMVGDSVSKVNGEVVSDFGLSGVREAISRGPRPMVVHFLQPVFKNPQHLLLDGQMSGLEGGPSRGGAGGGGGGGAMQQQRGDRRGAAAPPSRSSSSSGSGGGSRRGPIGGRAGDPSLPTTTATTTTTAAVPTSVFGGPYDDHDGDDDATAL